MAEITDIITKMLERTNENRISWQSTANEDTFIAVVGDTSTSVSTSDGGDQVLFRILNKEGREIERYDTDFATVENWEPFDKAVRELYTKAKRVALGVDSQLDDLLKALEE